VDTVPPATPVLKLPTAGATVTGMPTFSWYASAGATRYDFKSVSEGAESYCIAWHLTVLAYRPPLGDINCLGSGVWFVNAMDAAGNSSAMGEKRPITILPMTPSQTILSNPANGTKWDDTYLRWMQLRWLAADYGEKYDIQIDNLSTFADPEYTYSNVEGTYYNINALTLGKWYWRVRAKNSNGVYGPWSLSRYFTMEPEFNIQFNTIGEFEGWELYSGANWNVFGGYLSTNGLSGFLTSSSGYPATFSDLYYRVRMKMSYDIVNAPKNTDYYGLIVRGAPTYNSLNDWNNAYYFEINQYGDNRLTPGDPSDDFTEACYTVWKIVNGTWSRLTPADSSWCSDVIKFNNWNEITVAAYGSNLILRINDNLMWEGVVSGPLTGRLGIFTYRESPVALLQVDYAQASMGYVIRANEQVLLNQWPSSRPSIPPDERELK
jgi:hypothetical protein